MVYMCVWCAGGFGGESVLGLLFRVVRSSTGYILEILIELYEYECEWCVRCLSLVARKEEDRKLCGRREE